MVTKLLHECSICGTRFAPRFAYQIQKTSEGEIYICSQGCHERYLFAAQQKTCDVCSTRFVPQFAYQQAVIDGDTRHYCSQPCRDNDMQARNPKGLGHRIAVLNQKGGTGKTTTSVNLAAGLAEKGFKTLLVDMDVQGNVAVSLGLRSQLTLYHVLAEGVHPNDCVVKVNDNLDAIVSDNNLAKAEFGLVNQRNRDMHLSQAMKSMTQYDFIILDCGPSLSMLNQNALAFSEHILIPVSCDYLSLVGVKQILRTLKRLNQSLLKPVNILGVVPTFFDVRTKVSLDSVKTLRAYFNDRVLPPIRVNTRLKEAPSQRKTIFEYDPDCNGAVDYHRLVDRVVELCSLPPSEAPAPDMANFG
ncbi:MAG: ParA family protein [Bradymonadia bacterium]